MTRVQSVLSDMRSDSEKVGGILVYADHASMDSQRLQETITAFVLRHQAQAYLNIAPSRESERLGMHISASALLARITPDYDTTLIASALQLNGLKYSDQLELEIILAMACSPVTRVYPSVGEFESAIRVRRNAVLAAYQAELNFDAEGLERPSDCWAYHPETSFTLLPGVPIIDAMIHTMQPALSGQVYSFSCFRASEYISTLAIALELRDAHPTLHRQLEERWSKRAIMGEEFQSVFLREYGSIQTPIAPKYYVPGERIWFKNPDPVSSDIEGYEGSWLYYLGSGLFNNFWDRLSPYTIETKCLEIYHWRHGIFRNTAGELAMDESRVAREVAQSMASPSERARILELMMKYRDPYGVYAEGGCIDATREAYKWLHPATSDIFIPSA